MAPFVFTVLVTFLIHPFSLLAIKLAEPTSWITVVGVVYCDTCLTNTFSKHSYFLPGVDVHIQCRFKASAPRTSEQVTFSVNRSTNIYGIYKVDVPSVDGIDCVDGSAIESQCQATLLRSSCLDCNSPGFKVSTTEISVKSKQSAHCVYSISALSYRPTQRNETLCGSYQGELLNSLNSSNFFFPPYYFPWPPLPQLPPFPSLPPLPPMPPIPSFPPLPFPGSPSLPFPFPRFPPIPTLFYPPPPPAFNPGDPRTWFPPSPPNWPPEQKTP